MHEQKFLIQLYEILNNPEYSDCISWDETGKLIEIKDKNKLAETACKTYFGHSNYLSFTKQLNLYDFIKEKKKDKKSIKYKHKDLKFVKTAKREEILKIKKNEKQKEETTKPNNIFEDKKIKQKADPKKIENLLQKKRFNEKELDEIFNYLDEDNELEKIKDGIKSLNEAKQKIDEKFK